MDREEHARRYVRKPKPESKMSMTVMQWYRVTAPDGTDKGRVKLDTDSRRRWEAKGFTFKVAYGMTT